MDDAIGDHLLAMVLGHLPCIILTARVRLVCHRWNALVDKSVSLSRPNGLCTRTIRPCHHPTLWLLPDKAPVDAPTRDTAKRYAKRTRPSVRSKTAANPVRSSLRKLAGRTETKPLDILLPECTSTWHAADRANIDPSQWCDAAAVCGHMGCLRFVHRHLGRPVTQRALRRAAAASRVECVAYLCANGAVCDTWTCALAARAGSLDCLRFLHETVGCAWDKWTPAYAASRGQLECLAYAHEMGCPWDEDTCRWAAAGGHLACLEYAHTGGCPWGADTFGWAFDGGHMECIRFARHNGCPWDSRLCQEAAQCQHAKVTLFALTFGCPCEHHAVLEATEAMQSMWIHEED